MEPKVSLPCSKQPITGLYAEPDESNPYPISVKWILILSSDICSLSKHSIYSLQISPPNSICYLISHIYPANKHKQM